MPITEMIVGVSAGLFFLVAFIQIVRFGVTVVQHKTARRVIDRDPASAGPLLAQLGEPVERSDDRLAVILVALGTAMIAATLVVADPQWMRYGIAAALFPLIVGAGLWLRFRAIQRAAARNGG
ncbi:MAG TPA: hypothetical protein VFO42_00135 [Sphingomicrobium sp.]|nr:hypothetical protein [Sphingomicrobium sp.]